jgi:alkanesulfonate monooxygenase SsuD/methylene tetrahydromethanopterin reductase-like flavin-dependent oxidoreductase (luciferase family)
MEFGVFDHLDRAQQNLQAYYEDRLRIVELYDEIGIHRYHVAEHHGTPLGMSPSPSVYLAAVSQRTKNLRFGPMIYAAPLYHPLRLAEEICMVDQMSGGRLELGFGRGASPVEASFYGWSPEDMQGAYVETVEIILDALQTGKLNYDGVHYNFKDIPLCLEPCQKPYPPMWYGIHSTESAARVAKERFNVISLDSAEETRTYVDSYRASWREDNAPEVAEPCIGLSYFIVMAEDEDEALAVARRSYPVWHKSFNSLFTLYGTVPRHQRPADFDGIVAEGRAIAGTPETVTAFLKGACETSAINYLVGQFAFGDQSYAESERTIRLFAEHVMPVLKDL